MGDELDRSANGAGPYDFQEPEAGEDGLIEETSPLEGLEDAPGFVKRGIADLDAQAAGEHDPRPLSSGGYDEDYTAPGLRIPTGEPPPPASGSGQFVAASAPQQPGRAGHSTQPVGPHGPPISGAPRPSIFDPEFAQAPAAAPQGAPPRAAGRPSIFDPEFGQAPAAAAPAAVEAPPKGIVRRLFPTVLTGVVAFLVVSWAIVSEWAPPDAALVLMSVGMLVPTLLIAFLTSGGSKHGPVVRALPALIMSAAAIGGATTWDREDVRKELVPYVPAQVRSMTKMLADPSLDIAAAGCKRFAAHYEDPTWWSALYDVMSARPDLATRCVDSLPETARERIGRSLADRWGGELIGTEQGLDEGRACDIAGSMSKLKMPLPEASWTLMNCMLTAATPVAQKCCAQSLAATVESPEEWAKRLAASIEFAPKKRASPGVYAMAFHGEGLTPPQIEFVEKVGFNGAETQRVALELACDAIPAKDSDVIRHLRAAMEQCPTKVTEFPEDKKAWTETCTTAKAAMKAGVGLSPIATLCALMSESAVPKAIEATSDLVHKAAQPPT